MAGSPPVLVVAPLVEHAEASSVERVVESQLACLLDAGHVVALAAADGFRAPGVFGDPRLHRVALPRETLMRPADDAVAPTLAADVAALRGALEPVLGDVQVVLTHDVVALPEHLGLNLALRAAADAAAHLRFLHWLHSAPVAHERHAADDPRAARFTPFPNARFVYPNHHDAPRVADQFGAAPDAVSVVPHAVDLAALHGFGPLTRALADHLDLYAPSVLAVYPARLDRVKQHERLLWLVAELKAAGESVCAILVAFHSIDAERRAYGEELRALAASLQLTEREVFLTNDLSGLPGLSADAAARHAIELPRRVVVDLLLLANLYVHPSGSESFSFSAHEAAACGNLLVLNDDFPPMRELHGPHPLYARFSSTRFETRYVPDERAYFGPLAAQVRYWLSADRVVAQRTRIRRELNPATVFQRFVVPLLFA